MSGKVLQGVVVSNTTHNTLTVLVERYVRNPQYGKYVTKRKKYTVHNSEGEYAVGDTIQIRECRPISKTKRFCVVSSTK